MWAFQVLIKKEIWIVCFMYSDCSFRYFYIIVINYIIFKNELRFVNNIKPANCTFFPSPPVFHLMFPSFRGFFPFEMIKKNLKKNLTAKKMQFYLFHFINVRMCFLSVSSKIEKKRYIIYMRTHKMHLII